jgi:hypothetical protein
LPAGTAVAVRLPRRAFGGAGAGVASGLASFPRRIIRSRLSNRLRNRSSTAALGLLGAMINPTARRDHRYVGHQANSTNLSVLCENSQPCG